MSKYDIYKAVGKSQESNDGGTNHNPHLQDTGRSGMNNSLLDKDNHNQDLGSELNEKLRVFDTIVTHSFLRKLNVCPIAHYGNPSLSGMGWYKIEKIVIDKDTFFLISFQCFIARCTMWQGM